MRDDSVQRDWLSWWVELSQVPLSRILHSKKGHSLTDAEVEDTHNVWMPQLSNCLCLGQKPIEAPLGYMPLENLDCCWCIEVDVPSQVDGSQATASDAFGELIVPKALSDIVFLGSSA